MTNLEATCTRCDRPARGDVPAADAYPAHYCRQCSAEHCEMAAYLRERRAAWPSADDVRAAQSGLGARLDQHEAFLADPANFPGLFTTPQTHTLDVETVRGWVRLELTDAQAGRLASELATLAIQAP